jgi:hypothetical protein
MEDLDAKQDWRGLAAEEAAKVEWEAAKEKMSTAKRAEEAAKNVVCERVVQAQQAEEAAERRAREEAERRAERAAQTAQAAQAEQRAERAGQTQSAQAEQKECCICLETVAARTLLVLVPCGHKCVCAGCSGSLVGKPCPLCRKNVREVLRVYE